MQTHTIQGEFATLMSDICHYKRVLHNLAKSEDIQINNVGGRGGYEKLTLRLFSEKKQFGSELAKP